MLKILHNKKAQKKFWIVLTILILPSFILWGSGSILKNERRFGYIGKIFNRKIPLSEFQEALAAVKNLAIMQYGDKFYELQQYLNLNEQAWERLILLAHAGKMHIAADDSEVVKLIRSYPFFQNKGRFDNDLYSQMLTYVLRTQPREYEEEVRQNIILVKLYDRLTENLALNDEEMLKEYKKENEQLSIYYIAALYHDFADGITPGEEELKAYFSDNPLPFKEPPSYNAEYLVTDSEEKIRTAYMRLKKKADFNQVAKDAGLSLKETGMFNQNQPVPAIGWSDRILGLIARLKFGELSPPVKFDKNYYIFRVKEMREPYIPQFKAVQNKVKDEFIREKARLLAKEKLNACLGSMGLSDFPLAAKRCGLKSGSTDLFKYGSYIEGIGASDDFFLAARDLKNGATSRVILAPSGLYLIRLKSLVPVEDEKFQEEKKEFAQKLLAKKKEERFLKLLEGLMGKAQLFRPLP